MGGAFGGGKPDTSAAEESLRLQREQAKEAKAQAEEERRKYAEDMSSKRRARRAGGKRTLLAEGRFSPELGVEEEENKNTLGSA
jgi:hypothetical protein